MLFRYASLMALAATAAAHVSLSSPCVRYSPYCSSCPPLPAGQALDDNINAPIGTHDSKTQPLCKYTTPYGSPAAKWTAGSTVNIQFREHAAVHGGGHCQFALSYDGGSTFVVIHDELRYCFVNGPSTTNTPGKLSYDIPLPANLPSGDKVIFAWAWNNAIGNREFYMNCADVSISGGSGSFTGPEMLVANYGPESPFIPEFNGNYETGIEFYNARRSITVTGSGSSAAPAAAAGNNSTGYAGSTPASPPGGAASPAPAASPSGSSYQGGAPSGPAAGGAPTATAPGSGGYSAQPAPGGPGAPAGGSTSGAPSASAPSAPTGSAPDTGASSAPAHSGAAPSGPSGPADNGASGAPTASAPGGSDYAAQPVSSAPAYAGATPTPPAYRALAKSAAGCSGA
ncbi:hypothetical protein H4R18_005292 [Coemansia javaensis]|uniref:Chitin-binding type-4 domain-containing protein n=1 Tax=Coemansia javaensis TaxID=2761396 RepID=A0A9W8H303_9FUNG|nr:hypothetical protein H4R18_005292 [Coemansia javaensis]